MKQVNIDNFDLISPKFERENIQLGLSRIKMALEELNNPCKNIPAIQIVGTNGKSSTANFVYQLLSNEITKVLMFTSPHLVNFS